MQHADDSISIGNSDSDEIQIDGQSTLLPGQLPDGHYILSVLLKRTYDIVAEGVCTRAQSDTPLIASDVYWGDPMNSSVKYEADFVPYKLTTDVMLNGTAYAPGGKPVQHCQVSLQIEKLNKKILVTGNRTAQYIENSIPAFSEPESFKSMVLKYEYAYGGTDVHSDKDFMYPYPLNLLGKGFVVKNCKESIDNLQLPNIENPEHILTPENLCVMDYEKWEEQPLPVNFGCYPKTWWGRAQFAGVMPADRPHEQQMRKEYAKLVPKDQRDAYLNNTFKDMDFKFFSAASMGLSLPYLKGGERIMTQNLSIDGNLRFILPSDNPVIGLDLGGGVKNPAVEMQSVMIRMDDMQLDIVWRGAVIYPGPDSLVDLPCMAITVS